MKSCKKADLVTHAVNIKLKYFLSKVKLWHHLQLTGETI
jgi:hypothetical protein